MSTSACAAAGSRARTSVELGIFGALWSEHCGYKTSRPLLRALPTAGRARAPGPGENAGRGRHRRRAGVRLQDRVAQPPQRHRAVPGRGHRRRRHHARHLHHGRAAQSRCSTRCASARSTSRASATSSTAWWPASAATATASACPPSAARCTSTSRYRTTAGQRDVRRRRGACASSPGRAPAVPGNPCCWSARTPAATASTARASPAWSSTTPAERAPPRGAGRQSVPREVPDGGVPRARRRPRVVAMQDLGAAGLCGSAVRARAPWRVGIEIDVARGVAPRARHDAVRGDARANRRSGCSSWSDPTTCARVQAVFERWDLHSDVDRHASSRRRRLVVRDGEDAVCEIPLDVLVDGAPAAWRAGATPAPGDGVAARRPRLPGRTDERAAARCSPVPNLGSRRPVFRRYDHQVGDAHRGAARRRRRRCPRAGHARAAGADHRRQRALRRAWTRVPARRSPCARRRATWSPPGPRRSRSPTA